ncbi:MAG: hypothetical protein EBT20_19170, partial [Alphaproteobacteria bacterium]|nr:hypothetical protein [Alphaproteobacteria bacterium]
SNSWKIEALFEDAGIDLRRLVSTERLTKKMVMEEDWSFSKHEQENISSYLTRSSQQAKAMFDRIVGVEGPEL